MLEEVVKEIQEEMQGEVVKEVQEEVQGVLKEVQEEVVAMGSILFPQRSKYGVTGVSG